jgi:hypothetical protein
MVGVETATTVIAATCETARGLREGQLGAVVERVVAV